MSVNFNTTLVVPHDVVGLYVAVGMSACHLFDFVNRF